MAEDESVDLSWLKETPGELVEYELVAWVNSSGEQTIYMNRGEYIALKGRLAELRGLVQTEEGAHA